ncbi:hypothetical protein [Microbacterium testaceum]|uniref:hypothetical protein n=1 Tax=Microbacterium testaceum TaxID=2033 RepID=UPI002AC741DC|nr:hypothetical protein [Microbacterium testaceum]MDZ5145330.1 hypothetical protein [Microbacterium testaceum]
MDLVSGSALLNTIDTEVNKTRDYIAQRTSAVTPLNKGGTGATTAAAARTALGISGANTPTLTSNVQTDLDYLSATKLSRTVEQYNADFADRDNRIATAQNTANGKRDYGDGYFPGDLNAKNLYVRESFGASSGWTVAYINTDGRLSKGTSSLRYKDLLDDPDVDTLGNIWPALRQYAIKGGDGKPTLGWIAEEVAANPATERFAVYQWAEHDGVWGPTEVVDSIDFIQLLIAQTAQLNARVAELEKERTTPA